MQDKAVLVFKVASILFGVVGVVFILLEPENDSVGEFFGKLMGILGFIVLSSFAVAIAEKYLQNGKNK